MLPAAAGMTSAASSSAVKVVDRVTQTYPTIGVRLTVTKLQDPKTGHTYLDVRDASGALADLARVEKAEQAAKLAKSGKIDRALASKVSTMAAGQRTAVSIW